MNRRTLRNVNDLRQLGKIARRRAVKAGIVRIVAEQTGYTPATVSRTLAGRFDEPNPRIVDAIRQFLAEHSLETESLV